MCKLPRDRQGLFYLVGFRHFASLRGTLKGILHRPLDTNMINASTNQPIREKHSSYRLFTALLDRFYTVQKHFLLLNTHPLLFAFSFLYLSPSFLIYILLFSFDFFISCSLLIFLLLLLLSIYPHLPSYNHPQLIKHLTPPLPPGDIHPSHTHQFLLILCLIITQSQTTRSTLRLSPLADLRAQA